jgi:pimeloyl-ACP methyl ester carboxylesterase
MPRRRRATGRRSPSGRRGTADTAILPESFDGSADYVSATYAAGVVDDAGHFPHEEAPAVTSAILTEWLRTLP